MANLTKIISAVLYLGYESPDSVNLAFQFIKNLENISYATQIYQDRKNLDAIGSWVYGHDYESRIFENHPVFLWQEVYDNYDVVQMCAVTLDELNAFLELAKTVPVIA